jgi:hypothetical protein
MFSPGFFKESLGHFREWLDQRASCLSDPDLDFQRLINSLPFQTPVFHDAWVACHDADVLIESPSAMAGCVPRATYTPVPPHELTGPHAHSIHIAEALKIPYFRAFTMPWTRTHDYPQACVMTTETEPSRWSITYVDPSLSLAASWSLLSRCRASSTTRPTWPLTTSVRPPLSGHVLEPRLRPLISRPTCSLEGVLWAGQSLARQRAAAEANGLWSLCEAETDALTSAESQSLCPQNMTRMRQRSCPFVYNFSSAVVPHPLDWKDNMSVRSPPPSAPLSSADVFSCCFS